MQVSTRQTDHVHMGVHSPHLSLGLGRCKLPLNACLLRMPRRNFFFVLSWR